VLLGAIDSNSVMSGQPQQPRDAGDEGGNCGGESDEDGRLLAQRPAEHRVPSRKRRKQQSPLSQSAPRPTGRRMVLRKLWKQYPFGGDSYWRQRIRNGCEEDCADSDTTDSVHDAVCPGESDSVAVAWWQRHPEEDCEYPEEDCEEDCEEDRDEEREKREEYRNEQRTDTGANPDVRVVVCVGESDSMVMTVQQTRYALSCSTVMKDWMESCIGLPVAAGQSTIVARRTNWPHTNGASSSEDADNTRIVRWRLRSQHVQHMSAVRVCALLLEPLLFVQQASNIDLVRAVLAADYLNACHAQRMATDEIHRRLLLPTLFVVTDLTTQLFAHNSIYPEHEMVYPLLTAAVSRLLQRDALFSLPIRAFYGQLPLRSCAWRVELHGVDDGMLDKVLEIHPCIRALTVWNVRGQNDGDDVPWCAGRGWSKLLESNYADLSELAIRAVPGDGDRSQTVCCIDPMGVHCAMLSRPSRLVVLRMTDCNLDWPVCNLLHSLPILERLCCTDCTFCTRPDKGTLASFALHASLVVLVLKRCRITGGHDYEALLVAVHKATQRLGHVHIDYPAWVENVTVANLDILCRNHVAVLQHSLRTVTALGGTLRDGIPDKLAKAIIARDGMEHMRLIAWPGHRPNDVLRIVLPAVSSWHVTLTTLDLYNCRPLHVGMLDSIAQGYPHIRKLGLRGCEISPKHTAVLGRFEQLVVLDCGGVTCQLDDLADGADDDCAAEIRVLYGLCDLAEQLEVLYVDDWAYPTHMLVSPHQTSTSSGGSSSISTVTWPRLRKLAVTAIAGDSACRTDCIACSQRFPCLRTLHVVPHDE